MKMYSLRACVLAVGILLGTSLVVGDPPLPADPPKLEGRAKDAPFVKVYYLPAGQSLDKVAPFVMKGRLVSLNDQGYLHMVRESHALPGVATPNPPPTTRPTTVNGGNEEADPSADNDVSDVLIPAGIVISIKKYVPTSKE